MEPLDKKAKSVKACETCRKPFGITRMRHTCKRCNKIICADCTKGRIKIVTYDLKAAHKVCLACEKEHHFQVNFKTSNQTSWNTLSKIGQKWLTACDPKSKLTQSQEGYEESYRGYLEIVKNPYFSNQNEYFAMIDRDLEQGRLDRERTNYSFQEFLYHNQGKLKQDQVRASLGNVLKAIVVKFPEIGYCPNMNYVAMFLLALMDEESAFWMLGYVIHLLPANFYGQTDLGMPLIGFQQEKFVLSNLIKEHLNLEQEAAHKITTLLDVHGASLIAPLLANFTNFEVLFETWNKLLTNKTLNEARKIIIHMMKVFFPKLKDKTIVNPVEFQVMVIRLFGNEEFKDAQNIQIDDAHVKFLEAKFRGDHSNQWQSHEIKMHHALRKVVKINKNQIKLLKEQFNKLFGAKLKRQPSKNNQSTTEEAEGLAKEDFKKLLTEVLANDPTLMEGVDVDQLYDSFDSDKSGLLDFKEFLFLVSMVIKGSFEEKIQSAFSVFDSGDKGVLTSSEFDQFLQILIQTTVQANQNNITPFFNQDLEKFNEKMSSLTNDKEKISFDMIKKDLFNSNFIKYSEVIEQLGRPNDNTVKPTRQKEAVAETSVLHTNQTYMDSTQDTTHLTHNVPNKAEDLTRILDHSQSTICEIEESKYEDKTHDELLTEEQKIEVLGSPQRGRPEDEEREENAFAPAKTAEQITKAGVIGVEYTQTGSTKDLIDKFNRQFSRGKKNAASKEVQGTTGNTQAPQPEADSDSDSEQMRNLMQKWKGSPNKTSSSVKETLFDNPLTGFDSLTSIDDADHKPELNFNFGEDKQINLHSLASISRAASVPFAKNFLSPLSLSEVDIKPADISDLTLSFFNNISESRPERHVSANFSPQIRKPVNSDIYEALALDAPSLKVNLGEWKEGCFESNQIFLPVAQILNASMAIPKPFLDNSVLGTVQEQEPSEPPGLQMWRIDQYEQGDKPVPVAQPVAALRPLSKPIADKGHCYTLFGSNQLEAPVLETLVFDRVDTSIKAEKPPSMFKTIQKPFKVGQYSSLSSQNIVDRPVLDVSEGKLFAAFDTCEVSKSPAQTSATVKKPFFDQGMLMPLAPSEPEEYISLLEWKEGCFGAVEEVVSEMKNIKSMEHIRNPFNHGSHEGLNSEERQFEAPFVGGWKEDCFEALEKKIIEAELVKILPPAKKPFEDEGCAPLPAHERFFDEPVLIGWKEDCFGPIERPASLLKSQDIGDPISSPFGENSYQPLEIQERGFDTPVLGGWKEGCFQTNDTSIVQVNLVHAVSHVNKPFAGLACDALPPQGKFVELSSLLGSWKEDGFESAEVLLMPALEAEVNSLVRKPISGGYSDALPLQQAAGNVSLHWKEDCFAASELALESAEAVYQCRSIRKPFTGGHTSSLPFQQACVGSALLQNIREDFFISNQKQIIPLDTTSPSNICQKPIAGGVSQALTNQISELNIPLHWKEDCFVSSQVALKSAESVSRCCPISKPFDDGLLMPLPPQEESESVSLLGGWKQDWAHTTEKSISQVPAQVRTEVFAEEATFSLPAQERKFSNVSMQVWGQDEFKSQEINMAPMGTAQPLQVLEKPYCDGYPCQVLPKEEDYLYDSNSLSWKQDCLISFEASMQGMDVVECLEQIMKPFEENAYDPIQPMEREFDQLSLSGWAKDCFESTEAAFVLDGISHEDKKTRNPFSGGSCETVPADRRHFDDYILGDWKENCFNIQDQRLSPAAPSRPMKRLRPLRKIIKIDGVRAHQGSKSEVRYVLTTGKWDLFIAVDKHEPHPMPIVEKCQPAPKPVHTAGNPGLLVPETKEGLFCLGETQWFRSMDQASLPHKMASMVPNGFKADSTAYKNVAGHLAPDEADTEIIFISENPLETSQPQVQVPAEVNKSVKKALYGNQLVNNRQEITEAYVSFRYPFFNKTDKAVKPQPADVGDPPFKLMTTRSFTILNKAAKQVRKDVSSVVEEKKLDESGGTIVVENSASGSVEHEIKSDDFEVVKDSPERENILLTQDRAREERAVKADQKIVYDDEETLEDSTFLNRSALKKNGMENFDISVMTSINESSGDEKVSAKRQVDSAKLAGDKTDNCKVCNLF